MNNNYDEIIIDIFNEFSLIDSKTFGDIYFKHFKQLEIKEIFLKKNFYKRKAEEKGVLSEKGGIDSLIKDGMWSEEEEQEIEEKKQKIENLENGMKKIRIPSQRQNHKKIIEKEREKLAEIQQERKRLLGLTSEVYSENKVNQLFLERLIFYDINFQESVFLDIDSDDSSSFFELMSLQKDFFEKFSERNISFVSLSPEFSPYFGFVEDVRSLFGKPVKDLSSFQLSLVNLGRTFLNIFKNSMKEIPDNVRHDPDLLLEFHEAQKEDRNRKSSKAQEGNGGTTYFKANKSDIEQIASEDERPVNLSEEIKKNGGKLDMDQMMKLHGV